MVNDNVFSEPTGNGPAATPLHEPPQVRGSPSQCQAPATLPSRSISLLLAFASPEFEAAFQAYRSNGFNPWTLAGICHCTLGYATFSYKYLVATPQMRSLLIQRWYLGYLPVIGALGMLGLLLQVPAFYKKHRRALHTVHIAFHIATFRYARVMVLWTRWLEGTAATLASRAQFFATENFFASLTWLLVLGFHVGRIPDLPLATLFLLAELAGNPWVCGAGVSKQEGLITMSPEPLRVVEAATDWILGTPAGTLGTIFGAAPPRVVTCPLAQAFWQVRSAVLRI